MPIKELFPSDDNSLKITFTRINDENNNNLMKVEIGDYLGNLHCGRGPASLIFNEQFNIVEEQMFKNGRHTNVIDKKTNCKTPATKQYYDNGNVKRVEHIIDNILTRENEPAIITYYENGNVKTEEYYSNGVKHRIDGPAYIMYDENGAKIELKYYNNDVLHNVGGPAWKCFNDDKSILTEYYYTNGEQRRPHGPTKICYKDSEIISEHSYCIDSRLVTDDDWKWFVDRGIKTPTYKTNYSDIENCIPPEHQTEHKLKFGGI